MSDLKPGAFIPIFVEPDPGFALRAIESVRSYPVVLGLTHETKLPPDLFEKLKAEGMVGPPIKNRKQRRREAAMKRKKR